MNNRTRPDKSTAPHLILCRPNKRPLIEKWHVNAASESAAREHRKAGGFVAVIPGSVDGVVVDIDLPPALKDRGTDDEKAAHVAAAEAALVGALGEPSARPSTQSGGKHYWYPVPSSRAEIRNGKWIIGAFGGDIRGDRGFAILWEKGVLARLQDERKPPLDLAKIDAIRKRKTQAEEDGPWSVGERNEMFNRAVYRAVKTNDVAGIAAAVAKAKASGLPTEELAATLASGVEGGARDRKMTVTEVVALFDPAPLLPDNDFYTAGELLSLPPEGRQWAVDGLLPAAGFVMVAGGPFAGKSRLARDAAVCVARGERFLGLETRRGTVLCVFLEDAAERTAAWFAELGLQPDDPLLAIRSRVPPAKPLKVLSGWIDSFRPRVVILDTLLRYTQAPDLNDYSRAGAVVNPLHALALDKKTCIVALHHARKSGEEGEPSSRALGSQALTGAADVLWLLSVDAEGRRFLQTESRLGENMPARLIEADQCGRFTFGAERKDAQREGLKIRILEKLGELGELTATELQKAVGGNDNEIVRAREELVALGLVEFREEGQRKWFKLTGPSMDDFAG